MPATRRPGKLSTRSNSWNFSNAESFNDDMYSNMTFYDPHSPPSYATPPKNFKRQRRTQISSPYHDKRRLLDGHTSDSGYDSTSSTSPEPETRHSRPPTRQNTLLRHPTNDRSCKSDYYFIERLSADAVSPLSIEHGIGSTSNPSISFICTMQPLSLFPSSTPSNTKKRRRITNNDFTKSDADPLTYIRDNCENAIRALSSHRKLHDCDCDFAWLDNRKRGTGTVRRKGKVEEVLGPLRPCRKSWFTGWFVRQHLAYHDRYCACGCFGVKG